MTYSIKLIFIVQCMKSFYNTVQGNSGTRFKKTFLFYAGHPSPKLMNSINSCLFPKYLNKEKFGTLKNLTLLIFFIAHHPFPDYINLKLMINW